MKKTILAVAIAAWAAISAPANAATYMVNFDQAADGSAIASPSRITDQYSSYGLSFSLFENGTKVGTGALAQQNFGRTSNALWNNVNNEDDFSASARADVMRINFAYAADALSFMTTGDGDITTFNAYDAGGNLLQSVKNTFGGTTKITFTATGISRLDALQSIDNYTFSMDDLSFSATPGAGAVPETATWAMMILGMGAVGYSLRRAKRRSDVKFDAKIKRLTAGAIA